MRLCSPSCPVCQWESWGPGPEKRVVLSNPEDAAMIGIGRRPREDGEEEEEDED